DAPQRPLSREHLLQSTRVHEDVFDRSIDVQILRLRRKLERDPSTPRVIQTERGVGYVFAVPVERVCTSIRSRSTCHLALSHKFLLGCARRSRILSAPDKPLVSTEMTAASARRLHRGV